MKKESKPKFGGYVRITGGEYKGRKIRTPGGETHPMGERERLALFNIISDYLPNALVLDLYCGGGTLGIEAISRGAAAVFAIDIDKNAVSTATKNMKELGTFEVSTFVLQEDVAGITLKPFEGGFELWDIVFADPPYDLYKESMIKGLPSLIRKGGVLVLSHPGAAPEIEGLKLNKTRTYASAHLSFYVKD